LQRATIWSLAQGCHLRSVVKSKRAGIMADDPNKKKRFQAAGLAKDGTGRGRGRAFFR
jgi:hypothetical protein